MSAAKTSATPNPSEAGNTRGRTYPTLILPASLKSLHSQIEQPGVQRLEKQAGDVYAHVSAVAFDTEPFLEELEQLRAVLLVCNTGVHVVQESLYVMSSQTRHREDKQTRSASALVKSTAGSKQGLGGVERSTDHDRPIGRTRDGS